MDVMPTMCGDSRGPHAVAFPYTLKIRSGCEGGGKGALVQTDMSATLATNNDQYLFQPIIAAAGFKDGNGPKSHGIGYEEEVAPTLSAASSGTNQAPTIVSAEAIPIHDQATRFAGKRGDKSDGKGNGLGVGSPGDPMNTLTSADRHAVAFAMQSFGDYKQGDVASGLKARDYKDATDLVCGVDCRNMNMYPELYPTLQAKPNGGQSLNFSGAAFVHYNVRRLTPTECARLQGFADCWGHPDHKAEFSDEEFEFWLKVRNTHAEINGRAVKEYTKAQMLKWYNSLHTDSAEYKMWGNGIALPPALYCMQGIVDAISIND